MSYQFYPSGLPPYTPNTYVTDRQTPVNSYAIQNGMARDVASLQHNINTTNLMASGYAHPIISGFFKNIDTLNLYSNTITSTILTLNSMVSPRISTLFISGTYFYAKDSAFVGNNLQISDTFKAPNFFLNTSGLIYDAPVISGSVWDYYINYTGDSRFLNGVFNILIVNSGNITVDPSHIVILNSVQGFNPSGTISESGLYFDGFAGHDHKSNNVNAVNVLSGSMEIFGDLNITTNQGSINLIPGNSIGNIIPSCLQSNSFKLKTPYNESDFYILDYSSSGIYTGNSDYGQNPISGNIADLNIGLEKMIVSRGKVWALSKTLPTGCANNSKTFIYSTNDFYNWSANLISGQFGVDNKYISVSGTAYISDILSLSTNYNNGSADSNSVFLLWNMTVTSGNYCALVAFKDPIDIYGFFAGSGQHYGLGNCAYGSSKYGTGLGLVDGNVVIYGYEYPHINTSGIGQWDKAAIYNTSTQYNPGSIGNIWCTTLPGCNPNFQDLTFSKKSYKYSYPFMHIYTPLIASGVNQQPGYYWIDGSQNGVDGYLNATNNGSWMLTTFPGHGPNGNNLGYSGFYAGFFGNGFSEITSVLPLDNTIHIGKKGVFTNTDRGSFTNPDIIDNYMSNPVIVFGNHLAQVTTNTSGTIFGGCIPIMMGIDRRLTYVSSLQTYITSGNINYAPFIFNGSKSLMDDNYLFRIPGSLYYNILVNSNLYPYTPNNLSRLWTDPNEYGGNSGNYYGGGVGSSQYYNSNLNHKDCHINICPWVPGLGVFPFGGSGQVFYQHDSETISTKLTYNSMLVDNNGLVIPSGTFSDRNLPTYFDRPNRNGFWSSKTFDWFYGTNPLTNYAPWGIGPMPPSGSYAKSYYYMRPVNPIQYNGVIYCTLDNNTGFIYIGPDGPQYVDDNVMYSDLIKFGNNLYGVGCKVSSNYTGYSYILVLNIINRNISTPVSLPSINNNGTKKTPKFVIYNNSLFVGLGGGVFLVKQPDHLDLCLTNNL